MLLVFAAFLRCERGFYPMQQKPQGKKVHVNWSPIPGANYLGATHLHRGNPQTRIKSVQASAQHPIHHLGKPY
jgi:hypothetical protein